MSRLSPYNLTIGEDGLSVRCEWDAHYLTDEQLETARKHVETLQVENAKLREQLEGIVGRSFRTADKMTCLEAENAMLRELVRDMQHAIGCLVVLGDAYVERHEDELCALDDRMSELGVDA